MKRYIAILFLGVLLSGCEGFLDELNRTALSDAISFNDPASFDQFVANVYDKMRTATTNYDLDHVGTDIFTRGSIIAGIDELNDYVNMRPFNGAFEANWQNWYFVISAANTAIDRAEVISGLSPDVKDKGIGEVKFLRAYAYFNLVEQFGGVPLVLNEVRAVQTQFTRASEEATYSQILADLTAALSSVDETPSAFGRVSKSAVRHLQAKVLLTRAYKDFGTANDFTEAAALAEQVISRHPLADNIASLFSRGNLRDAEVVFSLLYGTNPVSRGVGNNRHLLFKFSYDVYPGMTRSTLYHRGLGPAPTPFFFSLFEAGDEREAATIRRLLIAEVNSDDGVIRAGDTAIFFPKEAWPAQTISSKPYAVVNPGNYFIPNGTTQVQYPMFRKFDDPGVPYTNPEINPDGERDAVIMRGGEARLIAAEAYLNAGNRAKAAEHVNALRGRAGLTRMLDESEITVDVILDESAKELAGEVSRWMDLKRTGKLIERALAHNPHVALNQALRQFHLLRPIPNNEVDLSGGSIVQNPDY
ncbi:RagB/SusD family nutrient uptake outer membrane protein [Parapedobacter tibetensis]|uniref:RagB/SusD family nutrient uptake outer membrane protein n=1 Tax=Parapedobacter tibetensis TaxID=2972951 RepID=UPI00214D4D79|nr:RagB/SusD family nutrient uptake outer membrane protein [Parapedobacter tibetensis]